MVVSTVFGFAFCWYCRGCSVASHPFCITSTVSTQFFFFFFNDPPPTEIYTLPLHDALPICEFLLAPVDLDVRFRRPSLAVLEFRSPCLKSGLRPLHGDVLGREGIAVRGELREPFLDARPLGGDRLLPTFPIGLGAGHSLLGVRFAVFHLVDPMLEALLLLPEGGLLRLDLPLSGFE